ncbi:MAG: hypothetical protein HFH80_12920 [Lachnospiraceae bacterium]|nr:hypothetical protein [Lachnospiraceae bacterium]
MKKDGRSNINKWRRCLIALAVFLMLTVIGCQHENKTGNISEETKIPEETEKEPFSHYTSDTKPKDCLLCGDGEGTLLPLYWGQKNLGIISLHTFDMVPVTINRYDDFGNIIEEAENGTSTHYTNTGEDGFTAWVSADTNRGYANGHLSFRKNEALDIEKAASNLCSECVNRIIENCWENEPYSVGVIDFDTGKVRLFEEKITAFTFGDYYISCDQRENDGKDFQGIDLLIFYCPERYPD